MELIDDNTIVKTQGLLWQARTRCCRILQMTWYCCGKYSTLSECPRWKEWRCPSWVCKWGAQRPSTAAAQTSHGDPVHWSSQSSFLKLAGGTSKEVTQFFSKEKQVLTCMWVLTTGKVVAFHHWGEGSHLLCYFPGQQPNRKCFLSSLWGIYTEHIEEA